MEDDGFIPGDWREWRRLRAWRLKQQGWCQRDISEALDVSEETVSRRLARVTAGGPDALRRRPSPGRPPKLGEHQRRIIPEFLWHGPEAYGFRGHVWTQARVARVIAEEFGVAYHKGHGGRRLQDRRRTPQLPVRRAIQRDEGAVQLWRSDVWPEWRRQARRERRTVVFEDEAEFYLLPGVTRTDAPEGETPVLVEKVTRDHLSVMGGMTPAGKVYTLVRQDSLNGRHSIAFLAHLRRVAGDRLLVIWDGSPIHRRAAVGEYVAGTRGKVRVEFLPAYAPDLNPWDEGGWNHLKNVQMRNLACHDLEEFHQEFHHAVGRLRQKPTVVRAFFAQAGLVLE